MSRHVILCSADQALPEVIASALDSPPRVTLSDSGLQVLAAVDVVHADLLVLDLETPGLNPLLLTSAIRALAPRLPILAISGRGTGDGRALSHRGVSFLSLPADRCAWRQALAAAIEGQSGSTETGRPGVHAVAGTR